MDGMLFEVAERSGVPSAPGEEVFVDAEHTRAVGTGTLGCEPSKIVLEPALDGGCSEFLPPGKAAAANPVPVVLKDLAFERFAGSLARQDPLEPLAEAPTAVSALPLAGFEQQQAAARAPTLMPNLANITPLAPQRFTPAVRARYRSGMPGRYRHPFAGPLDCGNLKSGQPDHRF